MRVFVDWLNLVWKRPPNLIALEETKPHPDRQREEGDEHRFHEILRDAMPLDGRFPRLAAWIARADALPRA